MTLALRELGYVHKDVQRMTPKRAVELWRAIPDPDLAPKQSDDLNQLPALVI